MKIDFYEEFPEKSSLDKLKLINFKSRVFFAAKSVSEFNKIKNKAKKINKKVECAYWPIVPNSYWISSFSNTEDLIKLFNELGKFKGKFLIDLEPPFKNKKLILKNIFKIVKNRKIIHEFLDKNRKRITIAKMASPFVSFIFHLFGLDYEVDIEKSPMFYSTTIPRIFHSLVKRHLINIEKKQDHSISLGIIEKGIFDQHTKFLSPAQLEKDLEFSREIGYKRAIIFRLGGLNKEYIKVINKFLG